jgi:hypothetical protein
VAARGCCEAGRIAVLWSAPTTPPAPPARNGALASSTYTWSAVRAEVTGADEAGIEIIAALDELEAPIGISQEAARGSE